MQPFNISLYSQVLRPCCPLELPHQPGDHASVTLDPGQSLRPQPEHVLVNPLPQEAVRGQGLKVLVLVKSVSIEGLRLHKHQALIDLRLRRIEVRF